MKAKYISFSRLILDGIHFRLLNIPKILPSLSTIFERYRPAPLAILPVTWSIDTLTKQRGASTGMDWENIIDSVLKNYM